MADTYRDTRDPYAYYHRPPHHQPSYSQLPPVPDYLGTPPLQTMALTNHNYHLPLSPTHSSTSGSMDYWYHHLSHGQYPPTPTSPQSPYSYSPTAPYSPLSPHYPSYSTSSATSSPRAAMPAVPDFLSSRESRPVLSLRDPYEIRHKVRKRRASASAIANLPTLRLADLPEDDRLCNICMEPYIDEKYHCDKPKKENATKMPCGHVFGSYCLKQWLQNNNTCPACRTEVDYVEVEGEEVVPRSRTHRRTELSNHEMIVNDLFGEPYRDPEPPRSKTPHHSRSRSYFGTYDPEPRPGTVAPTTVRPSLRRTHTGGTVRYPFTRTSSEDYSQYNPSSPPRMHGMREPPFERPGSATSSGAGTIHSEPTRGSDGYYSQPGLPSARNGRATPFRRPDMVCALEPLGRCMIEDPELVQQRLVRLDCGHGFHQDCLRASVKVRGSFTDSGTKLLWCERCRQYFSRKACE